MAYYTHTKDPIGCFTEKEAGNYFEYSNNPDIEEYYSCSLDENGGTPAYWRLPHLVWVGDTAGGGSGYRYATVKKTVAYIVTDEDEHGAPVIEKWQLKNNKVYMNKEVA
jgi:hypothetical protein|tara:strand:+ start:3475 stop:3801 length:327 start_codon:yes stop_codon:yes gene_type:complete